LICEECGVHGGNYKPATKYGEEDMSEFDGLVGIVTGGASGIGAAIAARLCRAGAGVAVVDRDIAQTPDEIFADDASVCTAVDAVLAQFGRLDVVVNNAGIGAQGTVADNTDEEWRHVFDVNVVGIVRMTRAALPALRRSPAAAIVNTCSIAATAGLPQRALYSATKGAVLALTRAMAADHIAEGIRVNCVSPGTTDTPWVSGLLAGAPDPRAERAALNARQPHGRLVSVEEVADAVAYLASPSARSTTGISIAVDGGMQELRLRN
jgi:NAD(P)-dependent dehydrogenase (short-subunit alcohol dehydrogenase family)